jgi:hypothetical protein
MNWGTASYHKDPKALAADLERRRAALHRRSVALKAPTPPASQRSSPNGKRSSGKRPTSTRPCGICLDRSPAGGSAGQRVGLRRCGRPREPSFDDGLSAGRFPALAAVRPSAERGDSR